MHEVPNKKIFLSTDYWPLITVNYCLFYSRH